jgi:hypothetical protein
MRYTFFTFVFLNAILQFCVTRSMELSSIDDDSPLKSKYLQEQDEERLSLIDSDRSKSLYTDTSERKKEECEEVLISNTERGDEEANLPCEIREHIIEYYSLDLVNDRKQLIPVLHYLASAGYILSNSYKEKIRKKIALCHALYVIDKMGKSATIQERQKLLVTATGNNREIFINNSRKFFIKTFWKDMRNYSLWQDAVLNFKVKKELIEYIRQSRTFADDLKKACSEFPEFLPQSTIPESIAPENESLDEDPLHQEKETLSNIKIIKGIIKGYYDTRYHFLESTSNFDGKWRDTFNALFLKLARARFLAPGYCCCTGSALCAVAFIEGTGVTTFISGLAGFSCLMAGPFTCLLCCMFTGITDKECDACCSIANGDFYEYVSGFPDNRKFVKLAQKSLKKESLEKSIDPSEKELSN